MLKNINKSLNILLFSIIVIFTFTLINTIVYNHNIYLIKKTSNNFFEKDSLIFIPENRNLNFNQVYTILPENMALFNIIQSETNDVRSISFKGVYQSPSLIEGRFFNELDFKQDAFLAVIGKNVNTIENIDNKNNKKYINFNNKKYEVIGIMGYEMPTRLDNSIILSSNNENFNISNEYILSSKDMQKSLTFLGNENIFGSVQARPYDNVNILHIIDRTNSQIILSIMLLIILFINLSFITYFWIKNKNEEINIKLLNGYYKYQIIFDICREYSIILIISLVTSSVFSIVFIKEMKNYNFKFISFMISLFLSGIINFVFMVISSINFIKKQEVKVR